ncbi:Fe/S-dependent 2-methylisocitrate dehydratase AcnD [Marinobacter sp. UBA2498]|uniref:Fe/S-dependent 2-methylisocitrate dehydratase AcnD n=1 Tax=Marinobacter sp. UBA2498 TaxID=1946813 RepID=UPI002580E889|nr:Fe/S-dependent 2-methylisocitrate dehydratase AcnD [Marinobacter sp. UBA2498]
MNTDYRKPLPGTDLDYFDTRQAVEDIQAGAYEKLPYTSKILAEQLVRRCDPEALTDSLKQLIERKRDLDFPWYPARVVCHDILGQTALVDLAGLRDAIAEKGGDPAKVNPVVPTQLIVDHSLAVEHAGFEKDAFEKNRQIEDRRNDDRFHFINWTKTAFKNVDVIPPGNGIMHQINLEKMSPVVQVREGVAYPDTCVGTDSHTPMVDALGVISVGVGGLEAENVMLGNPSMMRLPDIVGVELTGKLKPGITGTDLVLAITEFLRKERVVGAYLEFFGEGADSLSVGDRATIANMTPEYGATAGMFFIDDNTLDYLRLTGREDEQVALVEKYAKETGLWADALKGADYERVLKFDLSSVGRNLAGPSNPHALLPASDLAARGVAGAWEEKEGEMPDGAVIIAAITSCTNTSNPRNMIAAGLIARNANRLGLIRKPWVKSSLAPGSKTVKMYLEEAELLPELQQLGFDVVAFACTTCNGMSGALDPEIQKEVIDRDLYVASVLSGNRNFEGRIHQSVRTNWLASPPLVVAYALAGTVKINLEKDPLGKDKDGNDVFMKDIWPSSKEIQDAVVMVDHDMFEKQYASVFEGDETWKSLPIPDSKTYEWNSQSTYIQNPPFFDGLTAELDDVEPVKNARILAMLGDSVTTDHISPAGAIKADSPAGHYLQGHDVEPIDFNSYGSRRGNHEVMMRGTFANIRIRNEMTPEIEGGYTKHFPGGEEMPIYGAAMRYKKDNVPTVVVAGKEYGTGSSRDWAAKGTRLLGVRAVIAESYERIHRSNLIGMGVMPLQFEEGTTRKTLGIDGTETYDVEGTPAPRAELTLVIHRKNGSTERIPVVCRLDTAEEVSIYSAGGVLQRFAEDFLQSEGAA